MFVVNLFPRNKLIPILFWMPHTGENEYKKLQNKTNPVSIEEISQAFKRPEEEIRNICLPINLQNLTSSGFVGQTSVIRFIRPFNKNQLTQTEIKYFLAVTYGNKNYYDYSDVDLSRYTEIRND